MKMRAGLGGLFRIHCLYQEKIKHKDMSTSLALSTKREIQSGPVSKERAQKILLLFYIFFDSCPLHK